MESDSHLMRRHISIGNSISVVIVSFVNSIYKLVTESQFYYAVLE